MRWNRFALWLVWVAGGSLSVVHGLRPSGYALHSPDSAAVLETAAACGALLLSVMCYGRWRSRGQVAELATCYAFTTLAAGNVLFALLPTITDAQSARPGIRLAAFGCGTAAAAMLAIAAVLPPRATRRSPRAQVSILLLSVAVLVGGFALIGGLWGDLFPGLVGPPSAEATPRSSDVALSALQAASALAFVVASLRFTIRGRAGRDVFWCWLGVAAALWGLARVNYALTPAHEVTFLSVGDWLRLAAYVVAVVAVGSELNGYWRGLADSAVLEERRRIARDMHDGLAQELAFIATQSRALSAAPDAERAHILARAAERALDESRRAIAALTRPVDEPLDVALAQQAEELGGRLGVRVLLDLEPVGDVRADTREALLRIAREAITNAGRHGRPTKITVQLANHAGVTMRVSDDGKGFRPDDPKVFAGDRWGIAGMRERAEALGGRFSLDSRLYGGTRIEVWVP